MTAIELEEARDSLNDDELTDKQAAILAVFDRDPDLTYKAIADQATEALPDGESVSSYYASRQIKERRPEYFDESGDRLDSDQVEEPEEEPPKRVQELTEEHDDISEGQARVKRLPKIKPTLMAHTK